MKVLLCLYLSKIRLQFRRFFMSGFYFLLRFALFRCYLQPHLKCFGRGLLAVLVVVCSLYSVSSASAVGGTSLPVNSGSVKPVSFQLYDGLTGSTILNCVNNNTYDQQTSCGVNYSQNTEAFLGGFTVNFSRDIPTYSYSTLTLQINFATYGEVKFNGFVADDAYAVTIVDQQITVVNGTSYFIQLTLFNTAPAKFFKLSSTSNKGLSVLITPRDSNGRTYFNFGDVSYVQVYDGVHFRNTLNQMNGSLKSSDDTLKKILNNGITAKVDNSNVISQLEQNKQQEHQDAQNTQNAINNASNQAHQDSQAQVDATNKQTEQEKNQYDQEKQEEQDRENQANEDSDKAAGVFNFGISNPFSGLFALFSPANTCASIPILASWLHSDTTTVCSWWSPSIRSVLTSVFGISSIILLFGFFVRWLGSGYTFDVDSMDLGGKR